MAVAALSGYLAEGLRRTGAQLERAVDAARGPAGVQPARHRQPDERPGDVRHGGADPDLQPRRGDDHRRWRRADAVGRRSSRSCSCRRSSSDLFARGAMPSGAQRHEFGFHRCGRAPDRGRDDQRAADHAARRERLPLHVPGRHRAEEARSRGARAAAAGRGRRDGGRHRPRDPQSARVDGRIDPDPARRAAADRRSVAADGHRAARVGSAERHDPQLPVVRQAAARRRWPTSTSRQIVTDTARLLENNAEVTERALDRGRRCRTSR